MYDTLLRMWKKGKLTPEAVDRAVTFNWITQEQAEYIKSQPNPKH